MPLTKNSISQLNKKLSSVKPDDILKFAVLADTHASKKLAAKFKDILKKGCLFSVLCGDVTYQSTPTQFQAFINQVPKDLDLFISPGDHDIYNGGGFFRQYIGARTFNVRVPNQGIVFSSIDTTDHGFDSKRATGLGRSLKATDKLRFVFSHIPPKSLIPTTADNCGFTTGQNFLLDAVVKNNTTAMFFGHLHVAKKGTYKKIPFFYPTPDDYILVTIDKGKATYRRIAI